MSGLQLIASFLVVTLGWQFIARMFGPPLAKLLFQNKVTALQAAGTRFATDAARQTWAQEAGTHAMNMALLLLAAVCGAIAGLCNFPLIGFSRSVNGWSWLRIIAMCGVSWAVALTLHGGSY
ncbi:MAG TPA: hypothetical protein VLT79_12365 [Gemmatimonadales bacterium]|nr:hypothetical protein [Gemmatimonadales bacterium]